MNSFRISGLSAEPYQHLFGLSDAELASAGAKRYVVDQKPGFPDRVELRDGEPGETMLLVNYVHHDVDNPYRASHAIFVREGASEPYDRVGEIPDPLRVRLLSLRAFDKDGLMTDADVVDGAQAEAAIERLFASEDVSYIHAHYAKRGCFAARIDRA
jgi:hypothetical protein